MKPLRSGVQVTGAAASRLLTEAPSLTLWTAAAAPLLVAPARSQAKPTAVKVWEVPPQAGTRAGPSLRGNALAPLPSVTRASVEAPGCRSVEWPVLGLRARRARTARQRAPLQRTAARSAPAWGCARFTDARLGLALSYPSSWRLRGPWRPTGTFQRVELRAPDGGARVVMDVSPGAERYPVRRAMRTEAALLRQMRLSFTRLALGGPRWEACGWRNAESAWWATDTPGGALRSGKLWACARLRASRQRRRVPARHSSREPAGHPARLHYLQVEGTALEGQT